MVGKGIGPLGHGRADVLRLGEQIEPALRGLLEHHFGRGKRVHRPGLDIEHPGPGELRGTVVGIARAIVDREATQGGDLLANVNPTFAWVRLAQRVPVRIAIDEIPPGLALPYATCVEVGNSRRYTDTAGGYVDSGMIQVAVYAAGKAAARDLADAVADALDDADLEFAEGSLMLLRQESRLAGTEPDRAPGGGAIKSEIRTFTYMFSSGLS